jgi:hypothetical protein
MIFKLAHLEGIKQGKISLAFRKWKKQSVKKGSQIRTAIGVIMITDVSKYNLNKISEADAVMAGYKDLSSLLAELKKARDGDLYKIEVQYHSVDPRIKLRKQTALTDQEFETLKRKLEKLDSFSKQGNWTMETLKVIRDNPKLRAVELAALTGREKMWLKLNIRKLKNLGLTISHEIGYTLSPLGTVVLEKLDQD